MEKMYLIEEIKYHSEGDYDSYTNEKILVNEGVFTNEREAKARCVALARSKFDELTDDFNTKYAQIGYDEPEIEISGRGDGGEGRYKVEWDLDTYSCRLVSVTVN